MIAGWITDRSSWTAFADAAPGESPHGGRPGDICASSRIMASQASSLNLLVLGGRLSHLLFQDANTALVAISIVFSCGATAMFYALAYDWFGRNAASFAGLIFVFSPLAWFHGTVALTYIVETFFSALVGYLCWRICCGSVRCILPAAVVLGIAAGFRPSSLLLLSPLLLFSLRATGRKRAICGIGALALTFLAWFIPMIKMSGGKAYIFSLVSLWLTVPSKGMVFNSSPLNSVARALVIAGIYMLCFGCAAILPMRAFRGDTATDRRKIIFTRMWLAPGLLFFTFVFLKFVNSGYLLALTPPVCVWMGNWAAQWYGNSRSGKAMKLCLIGCCAFVNAMVFLYAPFYCSYAGVRRFEKELAAVISVLPEVASPRETMIVSFDSHFLGYRHAGYYLPGYLTIQFPEVRRASGVRVFTMLDRNTEVEPRLPVNPAQEFIIFPLPSGDSEYRDYMKSVLRRLPPADLRFVVRDGYKFVLGPVADLRLLFPSSSSLDGAAVHGW